MPGNAAHRNVALVVAAGRGHRLGGALPKQYLSLAGEPVLRHALRAFLTCPGIDKVAAVINPDDRGLFESATAGLALAPPISGGETRQQSVLRGLEALEPMAPERVLIHDAARPLVDHGTIGRVLSALQGAPGAIAGVPVTDTLKRAAGGTIGETVERANLWRAQTPQGFRFPEILAAHRALAKAGETGVTDDAAVAERAGLAVALVMGSDDNLKITTKDDLARAERLCAALEGEVRTGMGIDAHRFGPGDHLWLCGIKLPFDKTLAGHSDADVGLHAATDALLGAIGAGDIGLHFPPGDEKWRGAPSHLFLRHAADMVAGRGGRVLNLDITIVCERPRIGPHRESMAARVAEILGLARERVSVKATTTEQMGFTGRGEGIVAQAVATVRLPATGP
ncbi:MAG: bifunctional 2-C-methyl-D-erythritol 4-phosphate cytidylyltransferase/2-C-methyl-D-erythritol 2,4-cyclodiphosphate synthase [Alphaproteobacteria bacterium]